MKIETGTTESAFTLAIALCAVGTLLCGMLLDAGYISSWAHYFFLPYGGYLIVRTVAWKIRGSFPELKATQKIGVSMSPLFGFFAVFWVLFAKQYM